MKPRLLDAMGDALNLVRRSNLSEATALLRTALSGGDARQSGDIRGASALPPPAIPAPARRSLGEVLAARRAGRAVWPKPVDAPKGSPPEAADRRFVARSYVGAAGSVNYRIYVPADHAKRDLALVLMLHGCTQNPEDFAVGTQMNALADEFNLIVAYPHQPRNANASGCWNWFDKRHQQRGSGEPAKLAGLAQSLAQEFDIKRERTFVAGLSAGGAMAEVLAETYPELFGAVGIHSGLPYKAAGDVPSAFAAMKGTTIAGQGPRAINDVGCRKIIFHGSADATVHPDNGRRILERAQWGPEAPKQIELDWRTGGRRIVRTLLQDSAGSARVEHWVVEGAGHAWFGGDPRGTYTQDVGLDASRVMVRFFLQN
jgi:poly(hydroxyalkanoate) depolymerase family esterase